MEKDFHIAVVYQEPIITSDVVDGFEDDIQSPGLKVLLEPVPMMGARAALEWLMPTAIVAYIAKPYFESFLSEMGKDHYAISKKAFNNLRARIHKMYGERFKLVGTKGKLGSDAYKFSPVFSIESQTPFEYRVKLLIQTEIEPEQFNLAVEEYLNFLNELYNPNEQSVDSKLLLSNKPVSSVFLVCFNPEAGKLEYVDPIPEIKKP